MQHNKGFTLAEVLITLVIIGVIASVTIPTLTARYQEKATITRVKKIYSTISQAQKEAILAQGTGVSGWNYSNETEFFSYFKPYLSILKDCGQDRTKECSTLNENIKYLNGNPSEANYSGNYRFVLNDGSSLWFQNATNTGAEPCTATNSGKENVCGYFFFDTNGVKKPNTLGKDIFCFFLMDYIVTPQPRIDDCHLKGQGWGCASYILKYDNMNYPKN